MNNLRKFSTEAEYTAATLVYPSVSWVTSGDTVHFDKTAPTFSGKWKATYSNGSVVTAACDSTSSITQNEITLTNLVEVEIGDCVKYIDYGAFSACTSLSSITIPDNVTSIGGEAFTDCSGLTSVTIGSGVTSIGTYAFYGCYKLASIELPSGLYNIPNGAFQYCTSLTSVTIGSGVTDIGAYAFYSCQNLRSITCYATTPPYISSDTFYNVKNGGTLHVHPSSGSGSGSGAGGDNYGDWMKNGEYYLGYYGWSINPLT